MIRREITGPQTQFERSGAEGFRDVRPATARLAEALRGSVSGLILCGFAAATWMVPASVNLTVPVSGLYAAWVLTRRVTLPLRLPQSANMRDHNAPDPATRKPRMAAGSLYLGWDAITGQELWISHEDARQHASIPGTTGAGKTTAILSLLANSLTHNSGFVLVDGKADNRLYGEVLALARRFGREDDVLALNFLTASGVKDSSTFNPFATGNADAIRELLASQLGEQQASDSNGLFRGRAVALIGTMAPVLVYMRDAMGVSINIERIRFALELKGIWMLATHKRFLLRDPQTGQVAEIPVPDMPEDLIYPLRAYLGELPGYDLSVPYNEQKGDEPSKQHGFALFYFTATFTQLAVSLGHIFKVESGDVDMRDVVLNRRILVVNLPALENSDDTLAALGKIVVASLRGMMAQLLGARLEGDASEIFSLKPSSGDAPFHVVFDELAYYATSGMDRMYAMARGLNMMFWSAFQEVSGIWAKLGEKTQSLLGNANLTIAMRQQDANRTREWLEKTAGQTYVTQATSYHGGSIGQYRESQHAELRQVSRVDWADLQRLIEGEAIVLFGGRRIYAKLFHAKVDTSGPIRLNRPLMLAAPRLEEIQAGPDMIAQITENLLSGRVALGAEEPETPTLSALLQAFRDGADQDRPMAECAKAAIDAAGQAQRQQIKAGAVNQHGGNNAEPPVTDLLPMLEAASLRRVSQSNNVDANPVNTNPVNAELMRMLMVIEMHANSTPHAARRASLAVIADHNAALLRQTIARPASVQKETLIAMIEQFIGNMAA